MLFVSVLINNLTQGEKYPVFGVFVGVNQAWSFRPSREVRLWATGQSEKTESLGNDARCKIHAEDEPSDLRVETDAKSLHKRMIYTSIRW